ncbi:MAG: hypothetical protein FWG30_03865 [Eubacteriaceae bacterium]|nr:hypothetical protein [Eubacteriaceae bacterium]
MITSSDLLNAVPLAVSSKNSHLYAFEKDGSRYLAKCSTLQGDQISAMYKAEADILSYESYPQNAKPKYPKHYGYFEGANVGGSSYPYAVVMDFIDGNRISLQDANTRSLRQAQLLLASAVLTVHTTNQMGFYHMDIEMRNCLIDASNPYTLWITDYTGALCDRYSLVSMSVPFIKENPIYHQHVQLRQLLRCLIDNEEGEATVRNVENYVASFKSHKEKLTDFIGLLRYLGININNSA